MGIFYSTFISLGVIYSIFSSLNSWIYYNSKVFCRIFLFVIESRNESRASCLKSISKVSSMMVGLTILFSSSKSSYFVFISKSISLVWIKEWHLLIFFGDFRTESYKDGRILKLFYLSFFPTTSRVKDAENRFV